MADHPVFGRFYAALVPLMDERAGLASHRRALVGGLTGEVVEVGCGSGAAFAHYPATVRHVVAVEPDRYLRSRAVAAGADAPVAVTVVAGTAERLPARDGSFDAAVVSLVLCSVADQAAALAELRRVLRPGGQLRFLEHVRSARPSRARVQRAVDVVWPRLFGGCHTARDTVGTIQAAGFGVERCRPFRFPAGAVPTPTAPHVLGTARLPGPRDDGQLVRPPRSQEGSAMSQPKTAAELVSQAKADIENLGVDEVSQELESGQPLVVDLREGEELDQGGHIPGAVHAPRGMLEFYADPASPYHREGFDPDRRVILHCASGGRSALAVKTLQELGYTNVAHLDGGFNAWKAAGRPVEDGRPGG